MFHNTVTSNRCGHRDFDWVETRTCDLFIEYRKFCNVCDEPKDVWKVEAQENADWGILINVLAERMQWPYQKS